MMRALLSNFIVYYPIFVTVFWIVGTLIYYFSIERKKGKVNKEAYQDGISFLVPCYNEEQTITKTIENLVSLEYPNKEIIVINDGSSDRSADVIRQLQNKYDFIFIDQKENYGKANALNNGLKHATYEYIMCIDADTSIDEDSPYYMLESFHQNPTVGAVTGNPRIQNRRSLLGKIQVVEFASIIGCIKRAQTINGFVNTVSGVFVMFKKEALNAVGGWDTDMITEDIAISWKLHFANFKIVYEPRALCYMLVPETITGLWRQRVRWAQGGQEVLIRDLPRVGQKRNLSFWLLVVENILSQLWTILIVTIAIVRLLDINFLNIYYYLFDFNALMISIFVLIFFNIVFFGLSMVIDSRYEKHNIWYLVFLSWYPTFYWLVNALTSIVAWPKSLRHKKGEYATWTSPDRGEQ